MMGSIRSRELAAQAWCTEKTSRTVMNVNLADAFADILDAELASVTAERDELLRRYGWWKENVECLMKDNVAGCAFDCQIPLSQIESKSTGELMDMIADYMNREGDEQVHG